MALLRAAANYPKTTDKVDRFAQYPFELLGVVIVQIGVVANQTGLHAVDGPTLCIAQGDKAPSSLLDDSAILIAKRQLVAPARKSEFTLCHDQILRWLSTG